MKKFYYQLKIKEGLDDDSGYSIPHWGKAIFKGIVQAENSKKAREIIKNDIFEREFKKGVDDVLLSVLEVTEDRKYLEEFFEPRVCKYCGRTWTPANNEYYGDFCCRACYEQYEYEKRIEDNDEEAYISLDWYESFPVIYRIHDKKNDKNYIGQTIRSFTLRWWEHYKAWIQKVENTSITDFEFTILEVFSKTITKEKLSEREQYWINKYDAINNGYNGRNELNKDKYNTLLKKPLFAFSCDSGNDKG